MQTINALMTTGNLFRLEKMLTTDNYLVLEREGNKFVNKIYHLPSDSFIRWRETYREKEDAIESFQRLIDNHEARVIKMISNGCPVETVAKESMIQYG
jgi:hypothetical protein